MTAGLLSSLRRPAGPRRAGTAAYRLRLGINAAVVLTLLALAALKLISSYDSGRTFEAEFARADGARVGNEVRVAGIDVGKITAVRLDGDRIVVTFTVDEQVPMGARSEAELKVGTLLGSYYLELRPRGTGALAGNRIPLAQTRTPYTLDRIATVGGADLAALDEDKLRDSLGAVTDALGSDGQRLGEVLDGVTALTGIAAKRRDQIAALLREARRATGVVVYSRKQLFTLIGDTNTLLEELLSRREAISRLLRLTVRLNKTIAATMDENAKPVAAALRDLDNLLGILRKRDDKIRRSLTVLAPTVRYLSAAFGNGPYGMFRLSSPLPDNALCAAGMIKECS